jgi:hypothetical protein
MTTSPPPTSPALRKLACVNGPQECQLWMDTISAMADNPRVDHSCLDQIRSWIRDGITLDLDSIPLDVEHDNTSTVTHNADLVRKRLNEYIAFDAVVELSPEHPRPFGVQPLHVIIKPDRKPRLVIDLSRNLNDHLHYEYFSYSSVRDATELSTKDCWYGKLDLSNCFLSFPLHHSAWPHLIFRFDGRLYQFRRMPFGLASAPRICTMLLSVVHYRLSRLLTAIVRYLDDFLFISTSREASQQALSAAQQIMSDFGLVVNPDKTEGPSQQLAFLGIQLDSVSQTLSCTPARIAEITQLLSAAVSSSKIQLSALASLIGKLQFATAVLPGARPFVRRMLDLQQLHQRRYNARHRLSPATRARPQRLRFILQHARVFVDRGFIEDVRFWQAHLLQWNGSASWRSPQSQPFCFASDASLHGFGFYLESTPPGYDTSTWPHQLCVGTGFIGSYAASHSTLHSTSGQMTWCELYAVYAALYTYRTLLRARCALFLVDNETDVHILNRQATRSARLAGLLREIYTISVQFNISIHARHRRGVENTLADFLSRPSLHTSNTSIVHQWRDAHPDLSDRLSSVSFVSSSQFPYPGRLS